jgi:hypothetical protein
LWAFFLKILYNQLPVGSILKIRKPELYKYFTCVHCQKLNETIEHLTECVNTNTSKEKIRTLLSAFIPTIYKVKEAPEASINHLLIELLGSSINSPAFSLLLKDAFKGKFRMDKSMHISSILKISKQAATKIAATILLKTIQWIRSEIWIPRCKIVQEWEKAHNITNKDKRSKSSNKSLPSPNHNDNVTAMENINSLPPPPPDPPPSPTLLDKFIQSLLMMKQQMMAFIKNNFIFQ